MHRSIAQINSKPDVPEKSLEKHQVGPLSHGLHTVLTVMSLYKVTKNTKLLSFGDDDENGEESDAEEKGLSRSRVSITQYLIASLNAVGARIVSIHDAIQSDRLSSKVCTLPRVVSMK